MDSYKHSEGISIIRTFEDNGVSKVNVKRDFVLEDVEQLLSFKFSDFREWCRSLKEDFESESSACSILIKTIADFFFKNRKIIIKNELSVDPFIDILNEFDIGTVILSFITPDLSGNETENFFLDEKTNYLNALEASINLIAILAYFPESNFGSFLSGARIYPIIFDLFCNTNGFTGSCDTTQDMLSILINLSYTEETEADPFSIFSNDEPIKAICNFTFAYQERQMIYHQSFDSILAIRVLLEVAKKHPEIFNSNEILYIRSFFDVNITDKSYFYALKFAYYIMDYYSTVNECNQIFFDIFKSRLFTLSDGNLRTMSQEMIFIYSLFSHIDDIEMLLSFVDEIPIFDRIDSLLRVSEIAHSALIVIKGFLDVNGTKQGPLGAENVNMFDVYIFRNYDNNISAFIETIQSIYDEMSIVSKQIAFSIFSELLNREGVTNMFIDVYDFDNITNIIESSADITPVALEFIFKCVDKASKLSSEVTLALIDKFTDADLKPLIENLKESENEDIADLATRVDSQIQFYMDKFEESD